MDQDDFTTSLRQLQIIVVALMLGVLMYTVVAMFVRTSSAEHSSDLEQPLLMTLAGVGLCVAIAYFVVRGRFVARIREEVGDHRSGGDISFPINYTRLTIIAAALVEVVGMLGATIVLLTGNMIALGTVALALGFMGLQFPTRGKLENMIRDF